MTLGGGFVSGHLPYDKIIDRVSPDPIRIKKMLETYKPDCLINTIGYCGVKNIDDCEIEKEKTYIANTAIPMVLAGECEKLGIRFLHIASGCIFYGESPNFHWIQANGDPVPEPFNYQYNLYGSSFNQFDTFSINLPCKKIDEGWKETDFAHPLSFYSKTKYAADLVLENLPNTTVLRIRMPISSKNSPRNFISKIRNYKQVINIPNSITLLSDLTRCIDWAAKNNKTGIYHVVNDEPLTAAEVMQEYQKHRPEHQFEVISEAQLDKITAAKRSNCILNASKLSDAGFAMSPTKEALKEVMKEYIKNI